MFPELIRWYTKNQRQLPWRKSKDPYKIWLSEIILQQTQVKQGLPYYEQFILHFPDVISLSKAKEQTVLKLWQGLGYYSRARNLHVAAKLVAKKYKGRFPKDYNTLITLKGVGDYTASAISSICNNEAQAVLDGNVFRVLSRLFAEKTPINTTPGKKLFRQLAQDILDTKNPGDHNQAMMELGALICTPKNPDCPNCPLAHKCLGLRSKNPTQFPVKNNTQKIKKRFINYLVFQNENRILIVKQSGNDIWQGLYAFPFLETNGPVTELEITSHLKSLGIKSEKDYRITSFKEMPKHQLSHQQILAGFWEILIINTKAKLPGKWVNQKQIATYPFPVLIARYFKKSNIFV